MKWFFAIFFSFSFVFLSVFGINCFYGYLFPIKYEAEIAAASERFGVEKSLVFSVVNVESGFNKTAISSKGAVGLMQLLPSTAEELAANLGMKDFDLQNPEDNITLGTYYLSILSKKFENSDAALCAYNAGPANVTRWLQDEEKSEDGKILKEIPFVETRNYLQKIQKNLKYYSKKV